MKNRNVKTIFWSGFVAFMLAVGVSHHAEAKPVAAVGNPIGAHIILGDDKVDFCPPEAFLVIGKDVNGVDYFGCWRFKPEDKEVIQIVWSQKPEEILELPKSVFQGIPAAKPAMLL